MTEPETPQKALPPTEMPRSRRGRWVWVIGVLVASIPFLGTFPTEIILGIPTHADRGCLRSLTLELRSEGQTYARTTWNWITPSPSRTSERPAGERSPSELSYRVELPPGEYQVNLQLFSVIPPGAHTSGQVPVTRTGEFKKRNVLSSWITTGHTTRQLLRMDPETQLHCATTVAKAPANQ